ncbi:MAG: hypothetical protein U1E51_01950, partial [Candidatus Binatia bacterium]|nr:hypothetical protein [Candidatus Binatia bacterium]
VLDSLHTNANPATMPGPDPGQIIIDHLKQTLVQMVMAGDSGGVAAQTADLIAPDYAEQLRQTLQRNPLALDADPILSQCASAPNVRQFIAEFLQWFDEADRADAGDRTESATAAPAPAA